jgi:hypothetical protein
VRLLLSVCLFVCLSVCLSVCPPLLAHFTPHSPHLILSPGQEVRGARCR